MALLTSTRCYWHIGEVPLENINEAAETEQILQRADELRVPRRVGVGLEIGPLSGDQRFAPIRQNENELQTAAHARVTEDLQRLSLERVMRARDNHSLRKLLTVGSVWWLPSTRFRTNSF
jgi:hypothetical protein